MQGRIPDHLLDICIYRDKLGIQTRCVVAPSCRSDSAAIAPGESLLHHRLGTFGELITGETARRTTPQVNTPYRAHGSHILLDIQTRSSRWTSAIVGPAPRRGRQSVIGVRVGVGCPCRAWAQIIRGRSRLPPSRQLAGLLCPRRELCGVNRFALMNVEIAHLGLR